MKTPDISNHELLSLIQQVINQKGITNKQLAKLLEITPSSVHKMLRGNHITVERLIILSNFLKYNFFAVIAERLELSEPETGNQKRIYELEIENRTLMKLLKPE